MEISNILIVSDRTDGGAGVACSRLWCSLKNVGQSVDWLVAQGESSSPRATVAMRWPDLPAMMLHRAISKVTASARLVDRSERYMIARSTAKQVNRFDPGIINLHNIHRHLPFSFVEMLPACTPIVWTLHDMWSLTGCCCYSLECEKFLTGCVQCPESSKELSAEAIEREWGRRQAFFAANRHRIAFACPSRWLADKVSSRLGEGFRTEHIPYSLDTSVFAPVGARREDTRRVLGLPTDESLILFGADSLEDMRKGLSYFEDAVTMLRSKTEMRFQVAAFGSLLGARALPNNWLNLGRVTDEKLLNLYYSAADVYVLSSLADNLPNTLLEATSSGTPSVVFDVGGCPEVVRDGENGYVAKHRDAADLAECIKRVLDLPRDQAREMSSRCRKIAEQEYAPSVQAGRYGQLFGEMMVRP